MYYKALKDIKSALNRRYILSYNEFFFVNNSNYFYLVCENINFSAREQLFLLRKLQAHCTFIKVRKKIFFSIIQAFSKPDKKKIRNFFLYNPLILKIHVTQFNDFVKDYLILKDFIIKHNKKEHQFLSFSILFYEMNFFYSFNKYINNFNLINSNKLEYVYRFINKIILGLLNVIFLLFSVLNHMISLKKNANISSII